MGKFAAMAATRAKRRSDLNKEQQAQGLEPIGYKEYSQEHPLPWEKAKMSSMPNSVSVVSARSVEMHSDIVSQQNERYIPTSMQTVVDKQQKSVQDSGCEY